MKWTTLPLGHGGSPQYWLSHVDGEETFFVSFKPPRPGTEPRALAWKAALLTTTFGPPPRLSEYCIVPTFYKEYKFFKKNPSVLLSCNPRRTLQGFTQGLHGNSTQGYLPKNLYCFECMPLTYDNDNVANSLLRWSNKTTSGDGTTSLNEMKWMRF